MGDFNGDGYVDVLLTAYRKFIQPCTKQFYLLWLTSGLIVRCNRSDGSSGSLRSCIGDLNDDGFDDIVQASHYTGAAYATILYLLGVGKWHYRI